MKKSLVALVAVLIFSAFLISDLHARGGGGRGGAGAGSGRTGGGTGVGRSGTAPGSSRAGRNGRTNGNARTAKEWELLREEEDRQALIDARRNTLMEEDREASQEGWLAERRLEAADRESHTEDVR